MLSIIITLLMRVKLILLLKYFLEWDNYLRFDLQYWPLVNSCIALKITRDIISGLNMTLIPRKKLEILWKLYIFNLLSVTGDSKMFFMVIMMVAKWQPASNFGVHWFKTLLQLIFYWAVTFFISIVTFYIIPYNLPFLYWIYWPCWLLYFSLTDLRSQIWGYSFLRA